MKKAMPLRELLPLLGMTVSAFIFNTSEFMPIGLLTDIAAAFHITEAQAGMLITAYSWVVTLLSLPLMILACRMDFKRLPLGAVGLFGICQILSAVSPNFTVLLLSRLGVAYAHAIFWSIASPMAVRLVSEEHRSFALSMIVTGTSVAMIFGLPLGRMIGLTVGWRMTFASVAVVAFIVLFYMSALFPKLPGSQSFTLTQLPELFKNPVLMGALWNHLFVCHSLLYRLQLHRPFPAAGGRYARRTYHPCADSVRCSGTFGKFPFL